MEIAKKYADKVVEHDGKARQNIAQGRNDGAAVASGDYLLFLDADVTIPEINNFFATALNLFDSDNKLVGLTVYLKVLPEHVTLSDKLFFGMVNFQTQIFNNYFNAGMAAGEFQMTRAESFRQVGGYDPKLTVGEDHDLFRKLSKIGKTRTEDGLHVFHTSRRAHNVGWPKLLFLWWFNFLFIKIFKRSYSKEWKAIR